MDDLRNYLHNANADIFEIIKWAIMVAALDHPMEFRIKRDEIAQTLYSCDQSINCYGCHDSKNIIEVSDENDEETKIANERIKRGIVDEVLRIKEILDQSRDKCESESVVCDLLKKLIDMGLSVDILEETRIGKTVNGLQKHISNDVREKARTVMKEWKGMVDEWLMKQPKDHDAKQISLDEGTKSSSNKESKIKIEWKQIANDLKVLVIPDEQSKAMKSESSSCIEKKIEATESKIKVKLEKVENSSPKVQVIHDEQSKTMKCESSSNVMMPRSMNVVFKSTIESKFEEPATKIKIKLENEENRPKVQVVPDKQSETVKSESSSSVGEKRAATKSKIRIKVEKTKNTPKARVIPDEQSKASSRIEEKIEATKRKLQKGYSEDMKRKRRIQMIHSDEVTEQGLPPDRGLNCRVWNVGTQPKIPGVMKTEHVGKIKVHKTEHGWTQTEHGWQGYKLSGYVFK